MDTTEQYKKSIVSPFEPLENIERANWYGDPVFIKMCEKAEEIQPVTCPFHVLESREVFIWDGDDVWFHYAVGDGKDMVIRKVWLPRQDQLQEMLNLNLIALCRGFRDFAFNDYADATTDEVDPIISFDSMEQLWLCFVMSSLYQKTWDGGAWKK